MNPSGKHRVYTRYTPLPGEPAADGACLLFLRRKEHRFLPADLTAFLSAGSLLKKGGEKMCNTSGSSAMCSGVPLLLRA